MTDKQIEIADFLLRYLESVDGKSSIDSYPRVMEKQGFDYMEVAFTIEYLIKYTGLIDQWRGGNWIALTPDGFKASKTGIKRYLIDVENNKKLDINQKTATIRAVKISKVSMFASVLAVIISGISLLFYYLEDQNKSQADDTYQQGKYGNVITESDKSVQTIDSIYIERIKESLYHDTAFINNLKQVITIGGESGDYK